MLKRILMATLIFALCIFFTSCTGANGNNDGNGGDSNNQAPLGQRLSVKDVNELHKGMVWDVSPNGKKILFSWDGDKGDRDPADELGPQLLLYTLNLADKMVSEGTHLEKPEYIHESFAAYSPDGKYIAYMENAEESFSPYLVENRDGAVKKALKSTGNMAPYMAYPSAAWSPDSTSFAISYEGPKGADVVVYNTSGQEKTTVGAGNTGGYIVRPYFYDKDRLVFVKDGEIVYRSLGSENNEAHTITEGSRFAISNDKKHLACTVVGEDGNDIIKIVPMDADLEIGPKLKEININYAYETQLAWSPNNEHLLYTNSGEMWILNPESGDELLVSTVESVTNIIWVNDREIVFTGLKTDGNNKDEVTTVIYQVVLE